MVTMEWAKDRERLWKVVVVARVLAVVVLSSGYIHPDEFFQTTEVVAGDILDVQHQRTWEFTWQDPIRNIAVPYILYGPVLFLLRCIGVVCPCLVLLLPRLVVTAAGLVVDRCTFKLCRKFNGDGYTSLLLYSTSYVAWSYMTHTFSNAIETVLFAVLLVVTTSACEKCHPTHRAITKNHFETKVVAAILVVGMFNRPTFLIFAFWPVVTWLWNIVDAEWNVPNKIDAFIGRISAMALTSGVISLLFVIVDTLYYRMESVQHIPKDLTKCLFHDSSKLQCFGKMYTNYKPSIVVSPRNFLAYNSQMSNLDKHGSHPWFFHATVSLPLLFGPVVVFLMWRILKNALNVMLGGSLKVNRDFHLDDVKVVVFFTFPLAVFSTVSHQEPRFLLPLVPLGIVIATRSIQSFRMKWPIFAAFWVFNLLAVLAFSWLHQGGVLPAVANISSKLKAYKGDGHVVFYHTYTAPEHLFLHPEDSERKLNIHNLGGGASYRKLEQTLEKIRIVAADSPRAEFTGVWIVAPKTVVSDVKKLSIKFGTVDKYWHVSTEDPPRFMDWLKGKISLHEFYGDFSLMVVEVKSWKVFKDRG